MKLKFYFAIICLFVSRLVWSTDVAAQILNPNDTIAIYNSAAPPTQPSYGTIGKWVITRDITSWNTNGYKSYIYKGLPFRLHYPVGYQPGVNDGKTYPVVVFWHGAGEKGTIYDNDLMLLHGGQTFDAAINAKTFDGFAIYPQNQGGVWSNTQYGPISEVLNYMIANCKVDPYRIVTHGLSAGGSAVWQFTTAYPKMIAAASPMSNCQLSYESGLNVFKQTPFWIAQGALDVISVPGVANQLVDSLEHAGMNITYSYFVNDGHDTWDDMYANPAWMTYLATANKTNPTVYFGRSSFCPGTHINVSMGVTPGFDGYRWRRNGVVISGATTNQITVTDTGRYDVQLLSGSTWSYYSVVPAHIVFQTPTVTPAIQLARTESNVFPPLDTSKAVDLTVPGSFIHYAWVKSGTTTVIDTNKVFRAKTAGSYQVTVTALFGCSSNYSPVYTVINAAGTPVPDAASGVIAFAPSFTTMQLSWSQNPHPTVNETGFEIYRGTKAGGPYTFVGITPRDTVSFLDKGLLANTRYYYVVRAVGTSGAATASSEISAITQVDSQAPTAPTNLVVTGTTAVSANITWGKSTDNVGVYKYDIYLNNVKTYVVDSSTTAFTLNALTKGTSYTVKVVARDLSGNVSPASNQQSFVATSNGLIYKIYAGSFNTVPNFTTLTPVLTGTSANVSLAQSPYTVNYAYWWSGTINIPVTGNYTFGTTSDDGSNLYIDTPYNPTGTPTVANDGLHGAQSVEKTIFLTKGPHTFNATYFQQGGGASMQVYWKNTANGVTAAQAVPDSVFASKDTVSGTLPTAPSNLAATTATYKRINLTWTAGTGQTNFEITRSTTASGPFTTIATVPATALTYVDSTGLNPLTKYYYQIRAVNSKGGSAYAPQSGLLTQYYVTGSLSNLPDFNTLTPTSTTTTPNVDISKATQTTNYAYKWTGTIAIPKSGNYTFGTSSDDGSKLYLNTPYSFSATALVNNDGAHATQNVESTINLAKGTYPITITYFQAGGGAVMQAYWKNTANGVGNTAINLPDSVFGSGVFAVTKALPAVSAPPTLVSITDVSAKAFKIVWSDTSSTSTSYQIYRSISNNTSYKLIGTFNGTKSSNLVFIDSSLFLGTTYYYKITSKNAGGTSAYSNEISAVTNAFAPTLAKISKQVIRAGVVTKLLLFAKDQNALKLTLSGTNLPSFAVLKDNGDGTGLITFSPTAANTGVYSGLHVIASDSLSSTRDTFRLVVNINNPVLDSIPNASIRYFDTLRVALHASDTLLHDAMVFSTSTLPSFITLVTTGPNNAYLRVKPTSSSFGNYPITVTATDTSGESTSRNFTLSVSSSTTQTAKIYVNFNGDATTNAPAPWNNTTAVPAQNLAYSSLKNDQGIATTIGFKVLSNWGAITNLNKGAPAANFGPTTGNNTGTYPDLVETGYWWTQNAVQQIQFSGLQSGHTYSFTVYGATKFTGAIYNGTYTMGTQTLTMNCGNSNQNTITFTNVAADVNGNAILSMNSTNSTNTAFLNAIVVGDTYSLVNVPAGPTNLAVTPSATGTAKLTWTDNSTNEDYYDVYRQKVGTDTSFLKVNTAPLAINSTTYTDNSVTKFTSYNYKVAAVNGLGNSPFSNIVNFVISDKPPVLTALNGTYSFKTDTAYTIPVSATYDTLANIRLSASGLPANAVFTDLGNGQGKITYTPSSGDIGTYHPVISATNTRGLSSTTAFFLIVHNKLITSTYINFNATAATAPGFPWNSTNTLPNKANIVISSLKDENGVTTPTALTLVTAWTGEADQGVVTGNDAGIYPDKVLHSYYFRGTADTMQVQLSGLIPTNKYNFTFLGSWANPTNTTSSVFKIGGYPSVTLDPTNNTKNTVSLQGISPDATGKIIIKIARAVATTYAVLNSIVMQSYVDNGIPQSPTGLGAKAASSSSVLLTWQDRSTNETKFLVQRASSANGPFTVIDSVAANVVTYTDKNLSSNTTYYYSIVAKGTSGNSAASNLANATTLVFQTYVNFNLNSTDAAPFPWNNTNQLSTTSLSIGLTDDTGNGTGVVLTTPRPFPGYNTQGAQTGNNSGIYPDAVLLGAIYQNVNDSSIIQVANLNTSLTYNVILLTSYSTLYSFGNTIFEVNGKSITFNPRGNTTGTVEFDNIVPDFNGSIQVIVKAAPGASFGFVNSFVLQAHTATPGSPLIMASKLAASGGSLNKFTVYPNPFADQVTLNMYAPAAGHYDVEIYDINGRLVYSQGAQTLDKDFNIKSINLSSSSIRSGIYIMRINSDVFPSKSMRIIKR